MSIEKASAQVAAQLAMKGLMPYMAQQIVSSSAFQRINKLQAEADAFAAEIDRKIDELQAEGRRRYKELNAAVAALLSERGLQAVVDEMAEARAAPPAPGTEG